MAIIFQTDKRSNITYAYESKSVWDREKKQSRATRKLIGKVDKETGHIVPTSGKMRNAKAKAEAETEGLNKCGRTPTIDYKRSYYGATYLLDAISEKLGLTEDLRRCFPNDYKQILSLAYYLILEDKNPLYRFEKWAATHKHPYGKDIPSQRSSELFESISDDAVQGFFKMQGKRRLEKEYWVYDTTSISSYSEALKQVRYGYNKEDDKLPQLNLALVFGEQSGLPFYYRKLAGNIPDVKTVKVLLAELGNLGLAKMKLVMDRGFFSIANINDLMKERYKFLIAAKTSLAIVRKELDIAYGGIDSFENYNEDYGLYSVTVPCEWDYAQKRPYKGDILKEKRRVYIHLYYNIDRATEDKKNFDRRLALLRNEILNGKRDPKHESLYKKYFTIKETPVRGVSVIVNEEAVREAKRYYGYFALMSNEKMDSITALQLYRNKDVAEKAFGDLKERLNLRRTLVSSEKSLDGKLFVEFVSLILLSYLKKQMQEKNLWKHYTMSGVLDKLDVIECFERPGKALLVGELLEKQRQLYLDLCVAPPSSL
jgi:transposase